MTIAGALALIVVFSALFGFLAFDVFMILLEDDTYVDGGRTTEQWINAICGRMFAMMISGFVIAFSIQWLCGSIGGCT